MLYRLRTTQHASAAGPAGLQLFGSKPGDGPPSTGHRLCLETSPESKWIKTSFNVVKGELMKTNRFVLSPYFFSLLLFSSLSLKNNNLPFLLLPPGAEIPLSGLVQRGGQRSGRAAEQRHSWSCSGFNVLLKDTSAGGRPARASTIESLTRGPL